MNTENTLVKLVKKYEAKTDALSKCAAKKQRITELETQLRTEISELEREISGAYLQKQGFSFEDIISEIKSGNSENALKNSESITSDTSDSGSRVTGDTERGSSDTKDDKEESA